MSTPSVLKQVATGQQTAADAKNPHKQFSDQLERTKPQLLRLMGGSQSNVEKLCGVIERAVMDNPDLLQADRRSLVGACMKSAQDGLMPDGREAVLNVYNTKITHGYGRDKTEEWIKMVQYLPMVAGYVKGLYEHPDVVMVDAAAVYQNDRFLFQRGDEPKLIHEPTMEDDAGPVVAAYLVVKLKSGEIKREVMPRRDIEKVRGASKSGDGASSPWTKWYDQQAIKSVIKRGAKQLPRANKFDQIDQNDNEALGFAATPDNVGNAFMGAGHAALAHNPSDVIEHGPMEQYEEVPADTAKEGRSEPRQDAQDAGPVSTYADVLAGMLKAKTRDALDEAATLIAAVQDAKQRKELTQKFDALRADLPA